MIRLFYFLLLLCFSFTISAQEIESSPKGEWELLTETTLGSRFQNVWINQATDGWVLKNGDNEYPIALEGERISWEIELETETGKLTISARGELAKDGSYVGTTMSKSDLFGQREAKWTLSRKTRGIAENSN